MSGLAYEGSFEVALIDLLHAKNILTDEEWRRIRASIRRGGDVRETAIVIHKVIADHKYKEAQ